MQASTYQRSKTLRCHCSQMVALETYNSKPFTDIDLINVCDGGQPLLLYFEGF